MAPGCVAASIAIAPRPIAVCGHNWRDAADHGTLWSSRTWPIQPIDAAERHAGDEQGVAEPHDRRAAGWRTRHRPRSRRGSATVPPKLLRCAARVRTSSAVAIFGANHITRMIASSAWPAAGPDELGRAIGEARAQACRSASSPIQAGELKNISMAKASWKRLTNFSPGIDRNCPYCRLPWHQRWSRRRNSSSVGGFSSQPRSSSGSTRTS